MHWRSFESRKKISDHKWKRNTWFSYFLISLQIIHSISGRGVPSAVHLTVWPPVVPWWSSTKSRIDEGTARGKKKKSELNGLWPRTSEKENSSSEQGIWIYKSSNHRGWGLKSVVCIITVQFAQTHLVKSIFTVSGFVSCGVLNLEWGKQQAPVVMWLERQRGS